MVSHHRVRSQRILREAEGYLELSMPLQALSALARLTDPGTFLGQQRYLQGEAYRTLERFPEAITALKEAGEYLPSNIHVWLALGWSYKRAGQVDLAVQALERAIESDANHAILHYNLACYLSLAGEKKRALEKLAEAIKMEPKYREEASEEHDFDPIRSDPGFLDLIFVIA